MSLGASFLILALIGLAAAIAWQMLSTGLDAATLRRRRRWVGLGLLSFLLVLGAIHFAVNGGLRRLFPPEEDGSWRAVFLDGQPVQDRSFVIGIVQRRVAGGHDDCNSWAFEDEGAPGSQDRSIVTTLTGCEETPLRRAYGALAYSDAVPELQPDGTLRMQAHGHTGAFKRCKVQPVRVGNGTSEQCLFSDER